MNTSQLLSVLKNPDLLRTVNRLSLERLVREYPWFQTARLLFAKKYQLEEHPDFEQQLNKASIYAADRVRLFELMHGPLQFLIQEPQWISEERLENKMAGKNASVEILSEDLVSLLESIHEKKRTFLDLKEEEILDKEKQLIQFSEKDLLPSGIEYESLATENSADQEILSLERNQEDKSKSGLQFGDEDKTTNEDPLHLLELKAISESEAILQIEQESEDMMEENADAEMESVKELEAEIESGMEREQQEEILFGNEKAGGGSEFIPSEMAEESGQENIFFHSESESLPEIDSPIEVSADHFRIVPEVSSPGEFLPEKSYSFSGWLKFFRNDAAQIKSSETAFVATQKIEIPKVGSDAEEEPLIEPPVRDVLEADMKLEIASIDKVVSSFRKDSEHKQPVDSVEDLARRSLQMHEEVVSETLAAIYEEQGRISQAIRMYAKLSLKYPEKVSFFAARIKELKGKK